MCQLALLGIKGLKNLILQMQSRRSQLRTHIVGPILVKTPCSGKSNPILAFFVLEDALSIWTNLRKHLPFIWLFVASLKMGTMQKTHYRSGQIIFHCSS